jgi:hypothetical protein
MKIAKLLFLSTALISTTAFADCGKSKEPCNKFTPPSQEEITKQMNDMGPVFGNMAQSMLQARLAALADPKTTEQLAKFSRNYFKALVAQGFSEEQALKIVTSVGMPSSQ